MKSIFVITSLSLFASIQCRPKNVCRSLDDYRTIETNPNCFYNPDIDNHPKQIAARYGFPFESYEIKTKDGYFVTLFRIPHDGSDINRKRPVIFIQHGIAVDGESWMALGSKSIVFVLAQNGYDVWISNCRGRRFSTKHEKYTMNDKEYWLYSFHELALYDVDAMIDFIVGKTDQAGNITYIGHSMGTTISFVYSSMFPLKAKRNLKKIIALAPVAYLDNARTLLKMVLPFQDIIANIMVSLNLYGVGPNVSGLLRIVQNLCSRYPFILICETIAEVSAGVNQRETNALVLPEEFGYFPSGFSLKNLLHFSQLMTSKNRFQFFDYGAKINKQIYNSTKPPLYPLSQIRVPFHLFYGKNDLIATEKDVQHVFDQLNTDKTMEEVQHFSHTDFLYGKHANDFYKKLLDYI